MDCLLSRSYAALAVDPFDLEEQQGGQDSHFAGRCEQHIRGKELCAFLQACHRDAWLILFTLDRISGRLDV
jgi:hypothetical protein